MTKLCVKNDGSCRIEKPYEFYNIEVYTKGDLKGYAQGEITFDYKNGPYNHEFLFRYDDAENGENDKLVSIDYGLRVPYIMEVWDEIEKYLIDYVRKYLDR
jgi:hypothetical protein